MGGKRVLRNYDGDGNLISLECNKCHKVKAVSEFSKCKSKKDGVNTMCKDCGKQYSKEHYQRNVDKKKEYYAEYRKQNAEYYAEYRKENKDKRVEYDKERYDSKIEQSLIEIKAYVKKNPQRYDYNPNEEIYGIIYLVHNIKSDKYYVGQTINSFDIRYQSGWLYDHSYKDAVKKDLELYGEDSFEYVKIFKVAHNQQDLDRLEAYYIDYYNAYNNGYNETRGNIFTERK